MKFFGYLFLSFSLSLALNAMEYMPEEIVIKIFRLLSLKDIKKISEVCSLWNQLASSDYLWKNILEKKIACETSQLLFLNEKNYKKFSLESNAKVYDRYNMKKWGATKVIKACIDNKSYKNKLLKMFEEIAVNTAKKLEINNNAGLLSFYITNYLFFLQAAPEVALDISRDIALIHSKAAGSHADSFAKKAIGGKGNQK